MVARDYRAVVWGVKCVEWRLPSEMYSISTEVLLQRHLPMMLKEKRLRTTLYGLIGMLLMGALAWRTRQQVRWSEFDRVTSSLTEAVEPPFPDSF